MTYKNKLNNWAKAAGAKTTMSLLLGVALFSASCGSKDKANNALKDARTAVGGWENVDGASGFKALIEKTAACFPKTDEGVLIAAELKKLVYDGGDIKKVPKEITCAFKDAVLAGELFKENDDKTDATKCTTSGSILFIYEALDFVKALKDVFKDGNDKNKVTTEYATAKKKFTDNTAKVKAFYVADETGQNKIKLINKISTTALDADMPGEPKKAVDEMVKKVEAAYNTCINALK